MSLTGPSHLPRRVEPGSDDPWGFGPSDGALIECSTDTLDAVAPVRAVPPAVLPPAPPPPPWPSSIARPPPPPPSTAAAQAFAPPRRRHRGLAVAVAVAAVALSAVGGYWFADDARRLWAQAVQAAPPAGGMFVVSSQPPGAAVLVDGVAAGVTPLALQLTAGPHTIVATAGNGVSERFRTAVPAGTSASRHLVLDPPVPAAPFAPLPPAPMVAATAPAVPLSAFVTFDVPFEVRVYENGAFIGTNAGERIRVTPGRHTFTLVNESLGFRSEEAVVVGAGRSTRRVIGQPSAPLSVNAEPWAEVFIAGRSLGETPIANVALPVGTHQVTLRHPTLGEREVAMTVRLGAPNRLAVDMRRR